MRNYTTRIKTTRSRQLHVFELLMLAIFLEVLNSAVAQENPGSALYHLGENAKAVLSHSWKVLSTSTDNRPAYSIESFRKAVLHGVAANGQKLGELMPRYETDSQNLANLAEYLKILDFEQREGITTDSIQIAPPENQDERLGFIAAVTRFNKQGGSYGRKIVTEFAGQHFLSADSISAMLEDQLQQAMRNQILNNVVDDGVSIVALSNGPPDLALSHKLNLEGIQYDQTAPTMLVLDRHSFSQSQLDVWLERSERVRSAVNVDSKSPQRVYAPAVAIGTYLDTFLASEHELIIIDLDESAVRWALSQRYSARAAAGFAMGTLLGESILYNGRDPTRHSVIKSMNEIDLQSRLFTWRSSN